MFAFRYVCVLYVCVWLCLHFGLCVFGRVCIWVCVCLGFVFGHVCVWACFHLGMFAQWYACTQYAYSWVCLYLGMFVCLGFVFGHVCVWACSHLGMFAQWYACTQFAHSGLCLYLGMFVCLCTGQWCYSGEVRVSTKHREFTLLYLIPGQTGGGVNHLPPSL